MRELESKLHNRVIALYDEMSEVGENQYAELVSMATISMNKVVAEIDDRNRQEYWVGPVDRSVVNTLIIGLEAMFDDNPNIVIGIGERKAGLLWDSMELLKRIVTYGMEK